MPKYRVQLPSGETYEVDLPDTPVRSQETPQSDGLQTVVNPKTGTAYRSTAPDPFRAAVENAPALGAVLATAGTSGGAWPLIAAAGLGGAGGSFSRDLIHAATGEDAPSTAGGVMQNAAVEGGTQAAIEGGGQVLFRGVPAVLKAAGRKLYQGALKPTTKVAGTEAERQALIATGLREQIPVSERGYRMTNARIANLSADVQQLVDEAAKQGVTIDPTMVADRLTAVRSKFGAQVNPEADLQALDAVREEFLRHPSVKGRVAMPVDEAQTMKQGTYKALGNKSYGELKGAQIEGQKTLARGLKEEVESQVPAVGPLNARSGELQQLRDALEGAMRRTGNTDAIGLTDVIAATQNPSLLPVSMFRKAQSQVAIPMNRTGQAMGQIDPTAFANLVRMATLQQMGDAR